MKEFSDEKQQEIKEQISEWNGDFERSEFYTGLTDAQREESNFIIEVFAELMYGYYLLEPSKWTASALEECCLDLLPRKVSAGNEFYDAVEPVLTAYFSFLQEKGVLNNASTLIRRLKKVSVPMREAADSPTSWGIAKQLFMEAKEQGVDLSNQAALDRYVQNYNHSIRQENQLVSKKPKVGRNDPCPCGSGKKYKKCCGMAGQVIEFPKR